MLPNWDQGAEGNSGKVLYLGGDWDEGKGGTRNGRRCNKYKRGTYGPGGGGTQHPGVTVSVASPDLVALAATHHLLGVMRCRPWPLACQRAKTKCSYRPFLDVCAVSPGARYAAFYRLFPSTS